MTEHVAFLFPARGMNGGDAAEQLPVDQYARGVNVALVDRLPTTRPGVIIRDFEGEASRLAFDNIQGCTFHDPAKGQGGLILSQQRASLMIAAGGRKYRVTVNGQGEQSHVESQDVTGSFPSARDLHLAWWSSWENYALCQDGNSNCWIWDGENDAFVSRGYSTTDKPRSSVPNGGTAMAYVHGRGVVTVNSRAILTSDILHKSNQTSAKNLLEFTDQAYWATGQYFIPPSAIGNVTALAILPLRNTQHGHGELMVHCEDGVFSIDLNITPRSKWAETPMVRHALLETGATGPYAVATYEGDQVFRSRAGLETLRSAAGSSVGEPDKTVSDSVSPWFSVDNPRWLRFASVAGWKEGQRSLCTVYPVVQGRYRWHRGFVVLNFKPRAERGTPDAWEGLWTFPADAAGIVQFVSGFMDGRRRQFAVCRGNDKKNRLVEMTTDLLHDILPDGTKKPIQSQVVTRAMSSEKFFDRTEFNQATLFLRKIKTDVKWEVLIRTDRNMSWTPYRQGEVKFVRADWLTHYMAPISIPLGDPPKDCEAKLSRYVQFLIRWEGHCQIEGLRISAAQGDADKDKLRQNSFKDTMPGHKTGIYDDFSYSI